MSNRSQDELHVAWRVPVGVLLLLSLLPSRGMILASDGGTADAASIEHLPDENAFDVALEAAIQAHCVQCHAEADPAGDMDLSNTVDLRKPSRLDDVGRLIEVLEFEEMPPEDEPALSPELRQTLLVGLRSIRDQTIAQRHVTERAPIRRMNRFQYNNAVVDLFGLNRIVFTLPERIMREHRGYFQPSSKKMGDLVRVGNRPLGKSQMIEPRLAGVAAFPQDLRAEHGFDNRGDHLSLSPLLMEEFFKLGQSITQSPDFGPNSVGIWESFFAVPNPEEDLRTGVHRRLEKFLTQAFRGRVEPATMGRYAGYVHQKLSEGMPFPEAMKSVAAVAIASPRFLYLYNAEDGDDAGPSTDLDLASRLSFFLWGSLPDETLIEVAKAGKLNDPDELQFQFERMIKHRKLKRFCDSFPSQWLQLDRIISSVPDREKFSEFYFSKYRNSMHMMLEPLLVFETVLIENHPITQLIDSDFTYRSRKLQEAYGALGGEPAADQKRGGGVTVLDFRRMPVSDRRTGGVITNAAVMTMTSGPERTQPITRGAWIAAVIFNDPPKPPPADVPALDEKPAEGEAHLTLRERLALHRERSDCRGCHEKIDPLGFALENYGPIGRWREQYENGRNVDMQGTLFRKHAFNDVVEFKDAILKEKDRFARALAGHLLSFGLARELGAADQSALDKVVAVAAADEYRIQTLLREVVMSEPFRCNTGESGADSEGPL